MSFTRRQSLRTLAIKKGSTSMSIYSINETDDIFESLKTFEFDESVLGPYIPYSVKELHPRYGIPHTEETIHQMSKSKLGEKNPRYGVKLSKETKQKLSKSLSGSGNPSFGKSPSQETRLKQSAKLKGVPQRLATCPHCGTIAALATITKRHGIKCPFHIATSLRPEHNHELGGV